MFSGGIDSSGVLHQLFTHPELQQRPLIVHHIYLQNRENRAEAETRSVSKIINYYKEHYPDRDFTYTNSVFNTTGFAPLKAVRFPFDMDVCAFVAGNICVARKDIRQVATGRTKTDMDTGGTSYRGRITRSQSVFRSVYSLEPDKLPEYIFPVVNKTKKEIWDDLPYPIRAASWYCRKPKYLKDGSARKCGQCLTCKQVEDLITA
jgi:7-cyano-7-deazaguanine synthase in queuosine biosynthesis